MNELTNLFGMVSQLPLSYGGMYSNAFQPAYGYYGQGAGNMTNLGGQSMGLYGSLAGQQAQMYQSELPFQMEQQKFNSIAPVLGGLLNQWGGGGGNFGFAPISMQYNRPDAMSGYGGVVNNAYGQARAYDQPMQQTHQQNLGMLPAAPYMQPRKQG
jgi:hypothetical protein